jgi:poly [ADP-ribose] polymerase
VSPVLRCVPYCHRKEKPADEPDGPSPSKKMKSDKEDAIKKQNNLMYKYRDQLKKILKKKDLQYLLEYNDQDIPSGEERVCITFCYLCVSLTICVTTCRLVF